MLLGYNYFVNTTEKLGKKSYLLILQVLKCNIRPGMKKTGTFPKKFENVHRRRCNDKFLILEASHNLSQ